MKLLFFYFIMFCVLDIIFIYTVNANFILISILLIIIFCTSFKQEIQVCIKFYKKKYRSKK
jgi:hypothetical protein